MEDQGKVLCLDIQMPQTPNLTDANSFVRKFLFFLPLILDLPKYYYYYYYYHDY